jgi:hypothetical protein
MCWTRDTAGVLIALRPRAGAGLMGGALAASELPMTPGRRSFPNVDACMARARGVHRWRSSRLDLHFM